MYMFVMHICEGYLYGICSVYVVDMECVCGIWICGVLPYKCVVSVSIRYVCRRCM